MYYGQLENRELHPSFMHLRMLRACLFFSTGNGLSKNMEDLSVSPPKHQGQYLLIQCTYNIVIHVQCMQYKHADCCLISTYM